MSKRYIRILTVADNHGELIDKQAKKELLAFKKEWNPDITIHMGDCYNLDPLRKGATVVDKNIDPSDDIAYGNEFLRELKPNYFLAGNHDWRAVINLGNPDGIYRSWCLKQLTEMDAIMRENKTQVIPWGVKHGVLQLYGTRYIHGYDSNASARTRKAASIYGPVVQGHGHTPEILFLDSYDGGMAMTLPSMADNSLMGYQRGQYAQLSHKTGWGMVEVDTHHNRSYMGMVIKEPNGFFYMNPKFK